MSGVRRKVMKWQSGWHWAIFLTFATALSATLVALAQYGKNAGSRWSVPPLAVLVAAVLVVVLTAVDKIVGKWVGGGEMENVRATLRTMEALQMLLASLSLETGLSVDALGVSIFTGTEKTYRPDDTLRRVARDRLVLGVSPSKVTWSGGKGVIGECWAKKRERHRDLRAAAKVCREDLTPEEFAQLGEDVRMGLSYDDFMSIGAKYSEVLAVPIKSKGGAMVGVLSVDVRAGKNGASGNHLDPLEIRELVTQATDVIRDDVRKLEELE